MNDDRRKIISLAPNYDAKYIDAYKPFIDNALSETIHENSLEKKNKNIAISGGFGSGKSSVIRTYFKNDNHVIYVTLGSYVAQNDIDMSNDDNIEISILEQILYSVRPSKIPYSRFHRIDKFDSLLDNRFYNLIITFFLFVLFWPILLYHFPQFFRTINFWLLLVMLIPFVYLVYFCVDWIKQNIVVQKLSFTNLEISNEYTDESILNKYIDELIHFFLYNDKDIIIFEDLDRLSNSDVIFSKLKEINMILNSSIKNKSIRFIYLVGDIIFKLAEYRTKFFDIIVPIVPYSNFQLSSNELSIYNKNFNLNLSEEDIIDVGYYVKDIRSIYDIINEYQVYKDIHYKSVKKELDKDDIKQLLYLITYKVLYPKRFDDFIGNKGYLAYYFSNDFKEKFILNYKKDMQEKIDKLNETKNIGLKYNIKRQESLAILLTESIVEKARKKSSLSSYSVYLDNIRICSVEELKDHNSKYLTRLLSAQKIEIRHSNENVSYTILEDQIFDFMSREDFNSLVIYTNDCDTIDDDIKKIKHDIEMVNYNEISFTEKIAFLKKCSLPEEYSVKNKAVNNFEYRLIAGNIIKTNYKSLLVINKGIILSVDDEKIINKIKSNELMDSNIEIVNINEVFRRLHPDDFMYDAICLDSILKEINNCKNYEKYLEQFFNHLSVIKVNYIISYLMNHNSIILTKAPSYLTSIWNYLKTIRYEKLVGKDKLLDLVYLTLKYGIANDFDYGDTLYMFIGFCHGIDDYLEPKMEELKGKLIAFDLRFDYTLTFNQNLKFLEEVYTGSLFKYNVNLIMSILKMKKITGAKTNLLEIVSNNKDKVPDIYDYLFDDLETTIEEFKIQVQEFNDSEEFIRTILNDDYYDVLKKDFLSYEKTQFKRIDDLDDSYIDILINKKLIHPNWDNVIALYNYYHKQLNDDLITFVQDNLDKLEQDSTITDEKRDKMEFLSSSEKFTADQKIKLFKIILGDRYYSSLNGFSVSDVELLVNNDLLYTNNVEEMMKAYDKGLNDNTMKKLITKSFPIIKNEDISDSVSEKLLIDLLNNMELNNQDKVNYVLRYKNKDIFTDGVVNLLVSILIKNQLTISNDDLLLLIDREPVILRYQLFNRYYHQFNDLEELLSRLDERSKQILRRETGITYAKVACYRNFLDILVTNKIISHYDIGAVYTVRYKRYRKKSIGIS